tara:strand:- start:1310 stop:3058 length:1749 start_codon:yes stop_codon:yes gene_type:complete
LANYGVNINFKVIGQSKLDRALKKTEQLDKKVDLLNKRGIKGISSSVKILNQELAIKNKILKADQSILKVRKEQIKANKANAATQPIPRTGGGGGGRGAMGGAGLNSAIISGVFPLLFGQGPFAALGGATGGFFGGKFGGQMGGFAGGLAGTAIATGIQSGVTAIGELGQAMNKLNPDIAKLTEKMGILGTIEQKRLQIIEQTQGKQAALNEALEMMGDKIGDQNVQELKKFGETFQDLTNSTVLFFTKVQAQVAKLLNLTIGDREERSVQQRTSQFLQQNPNAPAFRDINQQIADLQAQKSGAGRGGVKAIQDQIKDLQAQKREIAETIILEKDKDQIRTNTNKLITAGLADLTKENELNRAIIAGNEEEFLLQQAIDEKIKSMGLNMEDLNSTQLERIKNDVTINQNLSKQAELTKDLKNAFEKIGESVNNDIKNGIAGLIKGTSTLGDMLNNVADRFLDLALNQALFGSALGSKGQKGGGILGALGLFAEGGRPPVGRPSIVGERGAELFVPDRAGTIIPNDKLGGMGSVTNNVVVNVDASGSEVEGDEEGGRQLGTLIAVAVQGEIVRQKRPGGLLSR